MISSFFAFDVSYLGGVNLGIVDLDGDGKQEILMGAGLGASPHVVAIDPRSFEVLASFFAFDPFYLGGVNPTGIDWDGDGRGEILVTSGAGSRPHVLVKGGPGLETLASFYPFDVGYTGSVSVVSGELRQDSLRLLYITAVDSPAGHLVSFERSKNEQLKVLFSRYIYGQSGFGAFGFAPQGGFRVAFRGGPDGGALLIPSPWGYRGELWMVDPENPSLVKDRVFSRLNLGSFAYFSGV
jgi:hypothetical protein